MGPLVYIAEIVFSVQVQHLELVFLADPVSAIDAQSVDLITVEQAEEAPLLPPLAAEIRRDRERGASIAPRWLGNLWDPHLARPGTPG